MTAVFDTKGAAPCPRPFNMAAHVLRHARDLPDKIALQVLGPDGSDDWSYGTLEAAVLGTGAGLLARGLVPGDIVLMRLGNTVEFPIAYLGCIAVGLVPVPTSSQLTEGEVARMIADLSPAAVFRGDGVACPPVDVPVLSEADLHAMRGLAPAAYDMGDPNRLGYIVYTSGTSGVPRAVAHAHRAVWARQMMVDGWYGLRAEDRLCHAGAFNWTYTLGTGLMDPWAAGATALIPEPGTDTRALVGLLAQYGATIFAAAPGVYRKMVSPGEVVALPALRHGLAAGEKLSQTIRDLWRDATGTEIYEAYGMSECSTFISDAPGMERAEGALGRPQDGRHIAILGDEAPVEIGEDGVIAVHRDDPGLMLGYYGAEEATAARFRGDWFLTGDRGVMDAEGWITYRGRDDDMMNAGGYRVSPLEVEAALADLPGIDHIGVTDIEVKDDVRLIMAFYTAEAPLDEDALMAEAKARLAPYKQPRRFIHVDALPTNPNGKLSRRDLRPLYKG